MSRHVYAAVKKCVFCLLRKVDKELVLRMSIGGEFQTFGAATVNARFANSAVTTLTLANRRDTCSRNCTDECDQNCAVGLVSRV